MTKTTTTHTTRNVRVGNGNHVHVAWTEADVTECGIGQNSPNRSRFYNTSLEPTCTKCRKAAGVVTTRIKAVHELKAGDVMSSGAVIVAVARVMESRTDYAVTIRWTTNGSTYTGARIDPVGVTYEIVL